MLNSLIKFAAVWVIALPPMMEAPSQVLNVQLGRPTLIAYERYVAATDARVAKEMARPAAFLYIDGLAPPRLAEVHNDLKRGQIRIERLETRGAAGAAIEIPDGLAHHWIGDVFVPGATLHQAIALAQDYNQHQNIYKPEVERSRLLSRNGNDFKIFYRLRKHNVITVTLNTNHDIHYFPVDARHWHSRTTTTRIAEVENAGKANESEKPVGNDGGFLWRMDSWWRWEEADGGVYIECESVSLTRDIPTGLGWLIRPFVTSIPKESLENTMSETRAALLARVAQAIHR